MKMPGIRTENLGNEAMRRFLCALFLLGTIIPHAGCIQARGHHWLKTQGIDSADAPRTIIPVLIQGLEQCKDTVLPEVAYYRGFKPFVEDVFPGLAEGRIGLLAHPGDHSSEIGEPGTQSVVVIGPEGGFIPYEVEKFREAGCSTITLGPRILRVENAVNTLLGRFL